MKSLFIILFFQLIASSIFSQDISEIQERINEANQKEDTLDIARAWYSLGKFYEINEDLPKSNEAFQTALYFANSINSAKAILSISNYLASNYSIVGRSDSALYYYKIALDASILNGDSLSRSIVLINIGSEYATIGKYVEAANHSISAIQIMEQLENSSNLAYYYQKVGEVYKIAGESSKWEDYILKAYQLIDNNDGASISAVAAIYNDLGGIAESYAKYDKALQFYDTLIKLGKNNDYPNAIGVALSNSATIYKLQGEIDKALNAALQAREYKNDEGYQNISENNLLAELFLEKKNTKEATKYAIAALSSKSINNYPNEKMRLFQNFYKIEKSRGNFEKALLWNEKYKLLSDSIRDKEIRTQIVDLEIGYQTKKKEQQIELLTTENQLKNQRINYAITIVAVLLLIIFMISYILRIRKIQAELIQNNLQQKVLRSQMNPHFIFNVLGSIQNFMLKNDNRLASNFLSKFASLTRATLNNSAAETTSLTNEINMLRDYIELEKMRLSDKFDFNIHFDPDLEIEFIQIPPMLIQPFVENSIKHGFKNLDRKGHLDLYISDKTNWIEFIIEDNGHGIQQNQAKPKKHQSMAMNIFEKRRKLIQQKHNKKFNFELINLQDTNPDLSGVRITIDIPIMDND